MGTYPIKCVTCRQPFIWFSGTMDQRCEVCRNAKVTTNKAMKLCNDLGTWCAKEGYILGTEVQSKLYELLIKEYGDDK